MVEPDEDNANQLKITRKVSYSCKNNIISTTDSKNETKKNVSESEDEK